MKQELDKFVNENKTAVIATITFVAGLLAGEIVTYHAVIIELTHHFAK